jgi:hypothetical protein
VGRKSKWGRQRNRPTGKLYLPRPPGLDRKEGLKLHIIASKPQVHQEKVSAALRDKLLGVDDVS